MLKPIDSPPDYLEQLPAIEADEEFHFQCDPTIECFNACCRDLDLVLGPYDVMRLRQALQLSSREFIGAYTAPVALPPTGFPALQLSMGEPPEQRCPFVTTAGCSVYAHRPSPCRSYPLGRGAERDDAGQIREHFVVVRESHCAGFTRGRSWTARSWLADQGLAPYNRANDRYLELMSDVSTRTDALSPTQQNLIFATLFQLDHFGRRLAREPHLTAALDDERRQRIMSDEAARLDYAFSWLAEQLHP